METLTKFYASRGHGCVFYERSVRSQHLQLQASPIPLELSDGVLSAFMDMGHRQGIDFEENVPFDQLKPVLRRGNRHFRHRFAYSFMVAVAYLALFLTY